MKTVSKTKWLRTPQALEFMGIGKTTLYSLADFNGGDIKTTSLKKRGKTRGVRLWSLESIEAVLNGETISTN